MAEWNWLTKPKEPDSWKFIFRVIIKAALLFVLFNVLFALLNPIPALGKLSLYNWLVPGRTRLPYGEDDRAYNLSLNDLNAMFASHEIAQSKTDDEFRVLLVGDSATWGILLKPEETLAGYLNAADLKVDGKTIRFYNLGHPIMALTKDLMLLDYAMRYQPDMVVWLTTLESFPRDEQLAVPIVQNNPDRVRRLIETYHLDLDPQSPEFVERDFLRRTLVGQRREIADWFRLQLFGVMWSATGIDQYYPAEYDLRSSDFEADISWKSYTEPQIFTEDNLVFDVVAAGQKVADGVPLLLINEPMFISDGENSDLRYNYWYPRWAYDEYRTLYGELADKNGWYYLDLWNTIAAQEFTDSPVHLTPAGSKQLSEMVNVAILALIDGESLPQNDR